MTNYKTTIAGIITGILSILAAFGVVVPDFLSSGETVGIIAGIGAAVIGILAKDSSPAL